MPPARPRPDGTVAGSFVCEGKHQGFPGWLHGAVMPMLVDAAMPPGLFVHRIKTVTGKLKPRFPRPVKVGVAATVRACKEAGHA